MSTALSTLLPERLRQERPERHLRPLDQPERRRRPKLIYAMTAVVGAIIIAVVQLGFSIATTQTTYEIRNLTEQQRSLAFEGQALYDDVAGLSSPQYLASNATTMGMVVGGAPTYLRLSDGSVIGAGVAAEQSTIDASRAAVANSLVSNTPLASDPDRTISGQTAPVVEAAQPTVITVLPTPEQAQVPATAPVVAPDAPVEGALPVPQTH